MTVLRTAVAALAAAAALAVLPAPAYAVEPDVVTNVAAAGGPGRILVTWGEPAGDGGSPVTGFVVYRKADGGAAVPLATVAAGARSYLDGAAPAGPVLSYGVAAVNAHGTGTATYTAGRAAPVGEVAVSDYDGAQVDLYAKTEGSPHALVDVQVPGQPTTTPAVSADGKRIAYAKRGLDGDWDIWVRAADGTGPERQLTFAAPDDIRPAWSTDGRRIAFVRGHGAVWTVPAAGGAAAYAGAGHAAAWLADSRTLVVANGAVEKVPPGGGAQVAVPDTSGAYNGLSVSPDGHWIAYSYDNGSGQPSGLGIGIVPVRGGASPNTFMTGDSPMDPTWRGDGRGLYVGVDNSGTASYSWDGTSLVKTGFLGSGTFPAYRATGLGLVDPPLGSRSAVTIRLALTGLYPRVVCRLDGGIRRDCSDGTWSATGLAAGRHTLVVEATRPGFQSRVLAHTWTVDLKAPTARPSGRVRQVTLSDRAVFRYDAVDTGGAGVASYDVRYRRARFDGRYGPYRSPAAWTRTTATSVRMPAVPGYETCFSVRARDHAGNVSPWSWEVCVTSPVDDPSLRASAGWARERADGFYRGTYSRTTAKGATLTLPGARARMVTLVVTKCPTCGKVQVHVGGGLVATVNLYAPVTQHRYRYYEHLGPDVWAGDVEVVVVSSGKPVRVDGVAVLRRPAEVRWP